MAVEDNFAWDAFISHASEDKDSFVEPLVAELSKYGLKIWFDKFSLRVGSSLRESIDRGLAESRFGIVVLSRAFFAKNWPKKELNGLFSRQANGHDVILPVWHDLTKEDVLQYSPLLSDLVAARSSEGLTAVARSLVQAIRPEAFKLETSRLDGQHAAARIREHLKNAHPQLDCRVTFGPQESDPFSTLGAPPAAGVVFSRVQEGTKIEVFAPDREAYHANPISFKLQMTKEAWEKLQEAQKKGKHAELGPDEVLGLTSDFFDSFSLRPNVLSSVVQKLVVGPAVEMLNRKFRFKLRFVLGEEAEEFPYVEFETVRPGQEEIEIRSSAPKLPFQLALTLNHAGGSSGMEVSYTHAGHEIRKIYKAHRAIQLFLNGGTLEILDLDSDKKLPTLQGARQTSPLNETNDYWEKFIEAAHELVATLNETLIWPERPTQDDSIHLQLLLEAIRTGEVSIPDGRFTLTVAPLPGVDIREVLAQPGMFRLNPTEPPKFATVFSKTFDLGPYAITCKAGKFEVNPAAEDPTCYAVRIMPEGPLVYQFERFRRDRPSQVGPDSA